MVYDKKKGDTKKMCLAYVDLVTPAGKVTKTVNGEANVSLESQRVHSS